MNSLGPVALLGILLLGTCDSEGAQGEQAPAKALPLDKTPPAELVTSLPLDLRATLSRESAPLFGPVQLALDLFVGDGVELADPFEPALPIGFEGELTRPSDVDLRGAWLRYLWTLRPVDVGTLTIGPFLVRDASGVHVATTRAFELEVLSSLLDAADTEIEADAESVEAPSELFEPKFDAGWIPIAGAIAVGLLLLFLLWLRFTRRLGRTERASVPLPPHVKALRALAALRDAPRRSAVEVEAFYVSVSHVLRGYLEDRFGLRAPERTTEEFLPEVEQSGVLDVTQSAHLRQFLEQCDLVKFAAARPEERVHDATFAFAEGFVESTRADRVSAVHEVATEGAA